MCSILLIAMLIYLLIVAGIVIYAVLTIDKDMDGY